MIENLAGKSPPWLAKALRALAPFMTALHAMINLVGPPILQFYMFLFKVSTVAFGRLPLEVNELKGEQCAGAVVCSSFQGELARFHTGVFFMPSP